MQVNRKRIRGDLDRLSKIGPCPGGGLDRHFGGVSDLEARKWLKDLWKHDFGLPVSFDPAANMWLKTLGTEALAPIAMGSHADTVKNGGAYDGAVGVLLATEVLRQVIENGLRLRHPFHLVSFTGEEPSPFGFSTLGSKIVSGKLGAEDILGAVDRESGVTMSKALKDAGGDPEHLDRARLKPGELAAFIECHIEQGLILDDRRLPVGVVREITGIYRERIHLCGEANHAGTTLMGRRHDALLAAAELMLAVEVAVRAPGRGDLVGTVGRIEVKPNSPNIIPGEALLTVEIRTPDDAAREQVLDRISEAAERIEKTRGVTVERTVILDQRAAKMDACVMRALERAAEGFLTPVTDMVSMAGHDAAHMAKVTRAGMLFVRTIGGRSHCPEELADPEDICDAGDVLLRSLLILDKELD